MDKKIIQQNKYILTKYHNSEQTYKNKYKTGDDIFLFLNEFENMNVYPIYPEPIVQKIEKDNNNLENIISLDNNFKYNSEKLDKIYKMIGNKLVEFAKFQKEDKSAINKIRKETEKKDRYKLRKYMGYEVLDHVKEKYEINIITNAWLKFYELLTFFKLIDTNISDPLYSFHICEVPGTFILATNHYIKTKTKRKFDWYAQSLNPWTTKDKSKFLPDQYNLVKNNKRRYDWGKDKTGDITNIHNIKYYINKYKGKDLVTSDCGQDSSKDFRKQEEKLNLVMWSQFVCAMGILKKGGNYVAKIFTIQTEKMIEMIYILTHLFEFTYIVKPIKTKPISGERYIVCKNYKGISDKLLKILLEYLKIFNKKDMLVNLNKVSKEFMEKLIEINNLMGYRRIANINQSIFQVLNYTYFYNKQEIQSYNNEMVNYYVKYYDKYFKFQKLM